VLSTVKSVTGAAFSIAGPKDRCDVRSIHDGLTARGVCFASRKQRPELPLTGPRSVRQSAHDIGRAPLTVVEQQG